jgi:hypothetical protein
MQPLYVFRLLPLIINQSSFFGVGQNGKRSDGGGEEKTAFTLLEAKDKRELKNI